MWVMLNDAFFSIVSKDCRHDELMVRARRKGDIEKVFPDAKVSRYLKADYLFRAPVKRSAIAAALAGEVNRITYDNFKDSVKDDDLHDAYLKVWGAMLAVQPRQRRRKGGGGYDGLFGNGFNARTNDLLPLGKEVYVPDDELEEMDP